MEVVFSIPSWGNAVFVVEQAHDLGSTDLLYSCRGNLTVAAGILEPNVAQG